VDSSDRPNCKQLFANSLLFSFAAVGVTCCLQALLAFTLTEEQEWIPLLDTFSTQLPILLLLGLGMAWVSEAVDSTHWRTVILAGTLLQLPLTKYVSGLFEVHFPPTAAAFTLLGAAVLPHLLHRRQLPAPFPAPLKRPQSLALAAAPRILPSIQPSIQPSPEITFAALAPKRTQASVLHCELLNHAQLVRSLPASEFTEILNRMLAICMETSAARGGQMDRSDSESFRSFFTHSKPGESHAESATYTALTLMRRLSALSEECELKCGRELDIRMGISTGEVLLAEFGPQKHQSLGVAGESAEWARRLAGANQLYGSRILISSQTRSQAENAADIRSIDLLQRQLPPEAPEEVFEVLALAGTLSPEASSRLANYTEGVAHFRARRWIPSRDSLRAARPIHGNDDTIDLLLHRIDEQEALARLAL
jgi:class 3 adenylate cyclase